jgi:hypothetical protein
MHNFKINIEITAYEIANLMAALKLVPNTGDWRASIITKIQSAVEDLHLEVEPQIPNAGLDIAHMRKHLDIVEHQAKHNMGYKKA